VIEPVRVVIADDHPYYRNGLARSLRAEGIDVVGEAPNGEAAIDVVEHTAPDVVVMDLKMPGLDGLEATRRLTLQWPPTRVLVLSVSADEHPVAEALLAGAAGYVLKDRPVRELVAGIRAVAAGEPHVSPDVAMPLLRRLQEPPGRRLDIGGVPLTGLERQVLELMHHSDQEIADALDIEPDAVRTHAASMFTKLQQHNRVEPALLVLRRERERG
jgi:DNA-binding NarL/FixJ family response regulator